MKAIEIVSCRLLLGMARMDMDQTHFFKNVYNDMPAKK